MTHFEDSGTYPGVPISNLVGLSEFLVSIKEKPRSTNLITNPSFGDFDVTKITSGFMSRWITPLECMYLTALKKNNNENKNNMHEDEKTKIKNTKCKKNVGKFYFDLKNQIMKIQTKKIKIKIK